MPPSANPGIKSAMTEESIREEIPELLGSLNMSVMEAYGRPYG